MKSIVLALCLIIGPQLAHSQQRMLSSRGDSSKYRMRHVWIDRDSTALWQHRTPDTGLIKITLKPFGQYMGRLIARDSQWVTIVTEGGLKQEILAAKIRSVSDFSPDTAKSTNPYFEPGYYTSHPYTAREHFEAYFGPVLMAIDPLPNSGAKGTVSWSATGMFGSRIPNVLYHYLGEFIGAGYETRGLANATGDTSWLLQYLSITPGLSYRGLVSLGLSIEVPLSAKALTRTLGDNLSIAKYASSTDLNVVLEPRLIVGLPVSWQDERMLMLIVAAGYPLTNVFANSNFMPGLKVPEVAIGVTYFLPLWNPYRSMGIL